MVIDLVEVVKVALSLGVFAGLIWLFVTGFKQNTKYHENNGGKGNKPTNSSSSENK